MYYQVQELGRKPRVFKPDDTPLGVFICFSINSRFVNLLFANILSHLANVLGQFPNFINLICSLNKVVYACVWDFFVGIMAKRIR